MSAGTDAPTMGDGNVPDSIYIFMGIFGGPLVAYWVADTFINQEAAGGLGEIVAAGVYLGVWVGSVAVLYQLDKWMSRLHARRRNERATLAAPQETDDE